jgi:hypothetical protein
VDASQSLTAKRVTELFQGRMSGDHELLVATRPMAAIFFARRLILMAYAPQQIRQPNNKSQQP